MKKQDLKNGMILEKNDGVRGIYHDGDMVDLNGRRVSSLTAYDDNLISKASSGIGIIKIFNSDLQLIFVNDLLSTIKSFTR